MGRYSYKETLSDEQNLGPQKDWPIVFEWMPSIQGWTCILYVFLFTASLAPSLVVSLFYFGKVTVIYIFVRINIS